MKLNNFWSISLAVIFLVVSGCASHPVRSAGPWINLDTERVYQEGDTPDLSEKPIDCYVPGKKKPVTVYSEQLCKQLIQGKKIKINRDATKKVLGERKKIYYSTSRGEFWERVNQKYEFCEDIKFKDIGVWCTQCRNSLADNIYCGMNGYYYPPPHRRYQYRNHYRRYRHRNHYRYRYRNHYRY